MKELWEQQELGGPLLGDPLRMPPGPWVSSVREGRYCTKPSLALPSTPATGVERRAGKAALCTKPSAAPRTEGNCGLAGTSSRWSPKSYRVWDRGRQGRRKANCSLRFGQREGTNQTSVPTPVRLAAGTPAQPSTSVTGACVTVHVVGSRAGGHPAPPFIRDSVLLTFSAWQEIAVASYSRKTYAFPAW